MREVTKARMTRMFPTIVGVQTFGHADHDTEYRVMGSTVDFEEEIIRRARKVVVEGPTPENLAHLKEAIHYNDIDPNWPDEKLGWYLDMLEGRA